MSDCVGFYSDVVDSNPSTIKTSDKSDKLTRWLYVDCFQCPYTESMF